MTAKATPLAVEFVDTLADTAERTLVSWMQEQEIAEEAWQLAEAVRSLTYYAGLVERGELDHAERFCIDETVHEAINNIAALGGVFKGADTTSFAREPIPVFHAVDPVLERLTAFMREQPLERQAQLAKQLENIVQTDPAWHKAADRQSRAAEFVELISQLDDAGLAEVEVEMRARLARGPVLPQLSEKGREELARLLRVGR